jgi:hypothetical protein
MNLCVLDTEEHECGVGEIEVYNESRKRELKTRPIYECRYDERLKRNLKNLYVSHTLGCSGNWNT